MCARLRLNIRHVCSVLFVLLLGIQWGTMNLASAQELNNTEQTTSEMRFVLEQYAADRAALNRFYSIPISPTRLERMRQFFLSRQKALEGMNFEAMSQDGRIDYILFKNQLQYELRQIANQEKRIKEVTALMPFWKTIVNLEESRRKMAPINPGEIAGQLVELRQQVEQVRKAMETGLKTDAEAEIKKVKKTLANRAANMIDNLRDILKNWFDFYNGFDPLFTWWVDEPYKKADQALQDYASFLREKIVGIKPGDGDTEYEAPIIGDPIGREALLSELAYAMIPYTPEELIALANREFAWCETEMVRASKDLGYGDDWHKALEYVKTLHVAPGEQPYFIREQALEAIEFVEKHDLVTVPPLAREIWKIEMMSPERQKVNPFFTGGEIISVSFPTNTMSQEQKLMSMRGNNIHFARATVHHELIPGHHLQGFMTARYRTYRRIFQTPFWLEGWPLHWEMLLWDLGFAKSPENRIGMLFWRMHRCARIIFSLNFHLEKMTPQECVDFLVNRVGHELENARAEVRRSCSEDYPPLYQCAYMIGGLQIRALYKEIVASGQMTNREFHDAILKENSMPIEMLRAKLTMQKLTPSFSASWKFAGDLSVKQ
jgi:uncharacterized protein (DUF885 family)